MTEQEFLASFGVEIDESGVELLQQEPARNRGLRGTLPLENMLFSSL